jgi:carbon storage regulator
MDIVNLTFEDPLLIHINDQVVKVVAFKTIEPGNIKFGIDAPRTVKVHREEIYQAIKLKEQLGLEK